MWIAIVIGGLILILFIVSHFIKQPPNMDEFDREYW